MATNGVRYTKENEAQLREILFEDGITVSAIGFRSDGSADVAYNKNPFSANYNSNGKPQLKSMTLSPDEIAKILQRAEDAGHQRLTYQGLNGLVPLGKFLEHTHRLFAYKSAHRSTLIGEIVEMDGIYSDLGLEPPSDPATLTNASYEELENTHRAFVYGLTPVAGSLNFRHLLDGVK